MAGPPVVSQNELVVTGTDVKGGSAAIPEAKFIENVEQFVGKREPTEVVGALQDLHARYKYLESGLLSQKMSLKTKLPDIESALDLVTMLQKKAAAIGVDGELRPLAEQLGVTNQNSTTSTTGNDSSTTPSTKDSVVKEEEEKSGRRELLSFGDENCLPVTYNLSENIWVHAKVPLSKKKSTLLLWLGANTLLEYTLDEAFDLLTTNQSNAKSQLETVSKDALYVRDQIVTTEVNIARCHNFGVLQRKKQKDLTQEAEAGRDAGGKAGTTK